LGKICLRDEKLAKKNIALFIKELESNQSDSVVRNNVLIICSDFARTFTSIIDNYVGSISSLLLDENSIIRRHSILLLSSLLTEDYIKWRGSLFFRFLLTIVDNQASIAQFAEQSFTHLVLSKYQQRFSAHFIESLFYFNDCTEHTLYNQFPAEKAFPLPGLYNPAMLNNVNANKRLYIYKYLLQHMTDEQKFNTSAKLVSDVLGSVVQQSMPLNDSSIPVLQDALIILASPHIKLSNQKSSETVDDDDLDEKNEQLTEAKAQLAAAKGKLLSKLLRKNTIEQIVPILIELKRLFEARHSPLLRYLIAYFKEIFTDYRSEISDILAGDRQLAVELEYDLRQFEQQQQQMSIMKKQAKVLREQEEQQRRAEVAARSSDNRVTASTPRRLSMSSAKKSATPATPVLAINGTPMTQRSMSKVENSRLLVALSTPFKLGTPIQSPKLKRTQSTPTTASSAAKLRPQVPLFTSPAFKAKLSESPENYSNSDIHHSKQPDIVLESIENVLSEKRQSTPVAWKISAVNSTPISAATELTEEFDSLTLKKRKRVLTPNKDANAEEENDENVPSNGNLTKPQTRHIAKRKASLATD
jgi:condensin-2 complex subunit D3